MSAVTQLLVEWRDGDRTALDRLVPIVYRQLQDIARRELRRERPGHTLQPTALVHEVFLRLVGQREASWENRAQFFAVAAQVMRRILVDHARAHHAQKRGGGAPRLTLTDADGIGAAAADVELLAVNQALARLAEFDPDPSAAGRVALFRRSHGRGDGTRARLVAADGQARMAHGKGVAVRAAEIRIA